MSCNGRSWWIQSSWGSGSRYREPKLHASRVVLRKILGSTSLEPERSKGQSIPLQRSNHTYTPKSTRKDHILEASTGVRVSRSELDTRITQWPHEANDAILLFHLTAYLSIFHRTEANEKNYKAKGLQSRNTIIYGVTKHQRKGREQMSMNHDRRGQVAGAITPLIEGGRGGCWEFMWWIWASYTLGTRGKKKKKPINGCPCFVISHVIWKRFAAPSGRRLLTMAPSQNACNDFSGIRQ